MIAIGGKIVCRRINRGSKNECDGFFIRLHNDAQEAKIKLKKNHHQRALKAFVGKIVVAKGTFIREIFVAKSVKLY